MNRKILIIINPGENEEDENYCAGVFVDADNYNSYFQTSYGGNWSENEISILDRPTVAKVKKKLEELNRCDFSIIVFCGHGFYSSKSKSNILELSRDNEIDALDLKKNVEKRIIILDCCRQVHAEYLTEYFQKAKAFSESLDALLSLNPEECEKYYNIHIEQCNNQIIVCHAANIGEFANDSSSSGGHYSFSLLKSSREWVDNTLKTIDLTKNCKSMSIAKAHNTAIPLVRRQSGDLQHPQIEKPRIESGEKYLPFIIIA